MMIAPIRTALVCGVAIAFFHTCWCALVLTGLAQPLIDFIFHLHFIEPAWKVVRFSWATAALLVLFTGTVGALFGFVFALIWNAAQNPRGSNKPV